MVPLDSLNDTHAHRGDGVPSQLYGSRGASPRQPAPALNDWACPIAPDPPTARGPALWKCGTPHRRTTHSHIGTTHNRTSPLSQVDGIDRLEGLRAAQDTPPTQTAAKIYGTTDYLTPHTENCPNGTTLDIVVCGHLKHEDQMGCGG